MEEKELFSSNDEFSIEKVCARLKENNITYIRRDEGAGSYMNVVFGQNTILEKKIFVNEQDYDKAMNLIEFENAEDDDTNIPDELKDIEPEDENDMKKYYLPRKIFKIFIIVGFCIPLASMVLFAIIGSIINIFK